ncbi:MAG: 50S ribosomal protein L19e [Nanoarchaeota archaeon]|nr:50S ribosomal protein L19e [Nanoarchaeota archaeon]
MKLNKKKELAARTLHVGKNRIVFNLQRLDEIKEAITKQDIKDLVNSHAIIVKEVKGRMKKPQRKTRIRQGSRRKKIVDKKREYIIITRKLRNYLAVLKRQGLILPEKYSTLRKEIRARTVKSLSQMKERILEVSK